MVDTIEYKRSQFKAPSMPNLNQVGSIFDGVTKAGTKLQNIVEGNIRAEEDALTNALRNAQSVADTQNLSIDPLVQAGASAAQLGQAENAIRDRQAILLGQEQRNAYDQSITDSLNLINTEYKQLSPTQQNLIKIDNAGSILPIQPQKQVLGEDGITVITPEITQAQIDEASNAFRTRLDAAGFKGMPTDREISNNLRAEARALGFTSAQEKQLNDSFFEYKKGLSVLTDEQKQIVEQDKATYKLELDQQLSQIEQEKIAAINSSRYTPEEAQFLLRTKETDLYNIVENDYPNEIAQWNFFRRFVGRKAGYDLKEMIRDNINKGYEPWQIALAIKSVGDTETDWENVDSGDFDTALKNIRKNKTGIKTRLDTASTLNELYDQRRNQAMADNQSAQLRGLRRRMGQFGIRDFQGNRNFLNGPTNSSNSVFNGNNIFGGNQQQQNGNQQIEPRLGYGIPNPNEKVSTLTADQITGYPLLDNLIVNKPAAATTNKPAAATTNVKGNTGFPLLDNLIVNKPAQKNGTELTPTAEAKRPTSAEANATAFSPISTISSIIEAVKEYFGETTPTSEDINTIPKTPVKKALQAATARRDTAYAYNDPHGNVAFQNMAKDYWDRQVGLLLDYQSGKPINELIQKYSLSRAEAEKLIDEIER